MATFYLLPPRACLEQATAELFGKLLPGLPLPADAWDVLARQFAASACWQPDVFLVPRDELPDGDLGAALAECYGAEPGDRVVEVSLSRPARTWAIGAAGVPSPAAAR
jgi:hypothetical protein